MNADDSNPKDADFRAAMADVRQRPVTDRLAPRPPLPSPTPRQSLADEAAAIAEMLSGPDHEELESGDALSYRSPGVQERVLRQLRRGGFRLEAELDLHGFSRDRARQEVAVFLAQCRELDRRCVRIIHGKGNGSPNSGPVLKQALDGWLRKFREVVAFCSARRQDGGTGAIYVLLRQTR